jgi:hypothetical protein
VYLQRCVLPRRFGIRALLRGVLKCAIGVLVDIWVSVSSYLRRPAVALCVVTSEWALNDEEQQASRGPDELGH